MQLKQAIENRRSIRGYLSKPVSQDILRQVLALASRAVSANNTQPWEFWVVVGDSLEQLRRANLQDFHSREPDQPEPPLHGVYRERSKSVGKQLFTVMEIARDDREKRTWWSERGFRFFDAPAVIYLCMDQSLDSEKFRFDLGCVAQNICLAAMEFGLGTCVEDQAIMYLRGLRQVLNLPESKQAVVGIAIGYPDDTFPANSVQTQREPVDAVTVWHGF